LWLKFYRHPGGECDKYASAVIVSGQHELKCREYLKCGKQQKTVFRKHVVFYDCYYRKHNRKNYISKAEISRCSKER